MVRPDGLSMMRLQHMLVRRGGLRVSFVFEPYDLKFCDKIWSQIRTLTGLTRKNLTRGEALAWYTGQDSNLRPSVPKTDALIH